MGSKSKKEAESQQKNGGSTHTKQASSSNESKKLKKQKKQKKKEPTQMAAVSSTNTDISPHTLLSSHSISRVHYIIAILSFIAGILAPPSYSIILSQRYFSNNDNSTASTRSGVITNIQEAVTINSRNGNDSKTANKLLALSSFVECNEEHLSQFLHDQPMKGIHIICFPKPDNSNDVDADNTHKFTIYNHASNDTETIMDDTKMSFTKFKEVIQTRLHIDRYNAQTSMKQPWAIFNTNGHQLTHELDVNDSKYHSDESTPSIMNTLQQHGMVLLFEGGSWLWPGVRIGFKRIVEIDDGTNNRNGLPKHKRNITIETLSLYPLVLSVPHFIQNEECVHIQEKAEPSMRYSKVSLMDKDQGRPASDFRTSQSAFMSAGKDDMLQRLEYRTASLTRVPRQHQELTQVLRYGHDEKYSAHLDWFDRNAYRQDRNTLKLIDNGRRNRLVTVFWYLSGE